MYLKMFRYLTNSRSVFLKVNYNKLTIKRFLRNTARGTPGPKFLEGKVKTVTESYDDNFRHIKSYEDLLKSVRSSTSPTDELEIEEALTVDDDFGSAFRKCDQLYEKHLSEEQNIKARVKQSIIKRKYFKIEKETNLLMHGAKEQLRYLHKLDPLKWTPEVLAESFPISVNGVKKLLKNKFVEKCPEKIKLHDEEVAKRWKILQSGNISSCISPMTQRLWREGKLVQNYFAGNPNLPVASPDHSNEILKHEKEECTGEFSSIIHKYVEYKKKASLEKDQQLPLKNNSKNDVIRLENNFKSRQRSSIPTSTYDYYAPKEDEHSSNYVTPKKSHKIEETELLHSQFKENLKTEMGQKKLKSTPESQYQEWIEEQLETKKFSTSKEPYNTKEFFSKIPKYQKDYIELKRDNSKSEEYLYDDKVGYQHPEGRNIRPKIPIPAKLHKQGNLYKMGQCVYDDDGEFLYKVPS